MNAPVAQQAFFNDLVADLVNQHQAEFFRNLHERGISPNDVELARLLRRLALCKAYYASGGKKGKADKFTYPVRIGGKQVRMMKIVALDSVEKKQGFEERVKRVTQRDNHLLRQSLGVIRATGNARVTCG